MQVAGEQQLVAVQPLQYVDRAGGLFDGGPGVVSLCPFGDLVDVVVAGAFPVPADDGPQAGCPIPSRAASGGCAGLRFAE